MNTFIILLGAIAVTNILEISRSAEEFYWKYFFSKILKIEKDKETILRKALKNLFMVIFFISGIYFLWVGIFEKNNELFIRNDKEIVWHLGILYIISIILWIKWSNILKFFNKNKEKSVILKLFSLYFELSYGKLSIGLAVISMILIIKNLI